MRRLQQKAWSSISQVLEATVQQLEISQKLEQYQLWDTWETLVGPAIAAKAQPTGWRKKILVVGVAHPTWLQELTFLKIQLLKRIQNRFPKTQIEDIRFELS